MSANDSSVKRIPANLSELDERISYLSVRVTELGTRLMSVREPRLVKGEDEGRSLPSSGATIIPPVGETLRILIDKINKITVEINTIHDTLEL